jgi:hypothetical protein
MMNVTLSANGWVVELYFASWHISSVVAPRCDVGKLVDSGRVDKVFCHRAGE